MPGTVATAWSKDNRGTAQIKRVTFTCVSDASAHTIPDTDFNSTGEVTGYYLLNVMAYPTGRTPPDAGNVFILDENDFDLLGSVDGGTTAYNGLSLIHTTLTRMNLPSYYDAKAGSNVNFYHIISGELTLKVTGMTTDSATYTIVCTFIR